MIVLYKKRVLFLLLILIGSSVFMSCNLLFGSLRGRENPNDDSAQIAHFTAVPSSTNGTIITAWEWRAAPDWYDSNEVIETVKVVHSTLGWPELNLFGEDFSFGDSRTYEWTGLKDGDHYFALFYKGEGLLNQWFAPIYAKVSLPGTISSGVVYNRIDSINIDSGGTVEWMPDNPLEVNSSKWAVVFFDIPNDVFITSATITLMMSVGAITEITFAPLNNKLPNDNWEMWNQLADGSIVNEAAQVTYFSNLGTFDITAAVQAASLTAQKAILVRTTDMSNPDFDNDASAPWITANIIK